MSTVIDRTLRSLRNASALATGITLWIPMAALLPAQEKAKTVGELRRENAELRSQVKKLQTRLETERALRARPAPNAGTPERIIDEIIQGDAWGAGVRSGVGERKRFVWTKRNSPSGGLDLVMTPGTESSRIVTAYDRARSALLNATRRLLEPATILETRRALDVIERLLLDVRRAVWDLRQAEKKLAPGSGAGRFRVFVPVLEVPVELDLKWPLLKDPPKEKLFFSFRRF